MPVEKVCNTVNDEMNWNVEAQGVVWMFALASGYGKRQLEASNIVSPEYFLVFRTITKNKLQKEVNSSSALLWRFFLFIGRLVKFLMRKKCPTTLPLPRFRYTAQEGTRTGGNIKSYSSHFPSLHQSTARVVRSFSEIKRHDYSILYAFAFLSPFLASRLSLCVLIPLGVFLCDSSFQFTTFAK